MRWGRVRARVLDVAEDVAVLGVYVEGEWVRVRARTQIPLEQGSWITGQLGLAEDGQTVCFRLTSDEEKPPPASSGLDLEA